MPLTDTQLRKLKPAEKKYRLSDGGNLYIEITPKGSKLWRMAYAFEKKQKTLAFGKYPEVSLAMARERRAEAKALLAQGIDPLAKKRADIEERSGQTNNTFSKIALELISKKEREGKAAATLRKQRWYLSMAASEFGDEPIKDITAHMVLKTLRIQEAKGNHETAHKLRTFCGEVFRFAVATGRADVDPTFALRGALIRHKTEHMAALVNKDDYAGLVRAIWQYKGSGPSIRAALKLMVLLYPRPGELRLAQWSEFDLINGVWTIPAERMKMRVEHRKPLSDEVVQILSELRLLAGTGDLTFPSLHARGRPLSENTLNQALRRMGYDKTEATSHGFRSSASSILNESGKWNPDAIEAELAHKNVNPIRGAYMRTMFWEERVQMASWWAKEILGMLN